MKFLGIDYGTKRIGLAISDDNGVLAFPKEVIKNNGELLRKIGEIISQEKIGEIVVGESLDFAGLPNLLQKEIEFFISNLERKFKIKVHPEREFLTSVEARRFKDNKSGLNPSQAHSRAKKIRQANSLWVDASAAALILQRYLDRRPGQKEG